MRSFLDIENGVFDPTRRFAFTNITAEDFRSTWDGRPIDVKAGQTVELPHHLAVKLTGELVDKIMYGEAHMDEVQKNTPYYRSPKYSSVGIPQARKVWEDKILQELDVDQQSPEFQIIASKIGEELKRDMSSEKSIEPPTLS